MVKYKVTLEMKETYVIYVEAGSEDAAIELANQVTLDSWESTDLSTQSIDAAEIEPITEEDNI